MFSAGQMAPQQSPYGYGGYPQQGGYGYGYGGGMASPYGMGPSFQPVGLAPYNSGVSSPNINVETTMSEKATTNYMYGSLGIQAAGVVGGIVSQALNYKLATKAMEQQGKIAIKYYDTQDHIASYQKEVSIAQIGLQGQAIDAQKSMHKDQIRHEENMARLEGNTQARLAQIGEAGKVERAKIYSVNNAFSGVSQDPLGRNSYSYGIG